MSVDVATPLLALFAGWLLSEVTRWRVLRSEQRQPIALALAELLEIRHHLAAHQAAVDEAVSELGVPPDFHYLVARAIRAGFPPQNKLHERYDDAVSRVAAFDPILGFELRSKNIVGLVSKTIESVAPTDHHSQVLAYQIEAKVVSMTIPLLENTITRIAFRYDLFTWWSVRNYLRRPMVGSPDAKQYFADLKKMIEQESAQQPNQPVQPTPDGAADRQR